MSMKGMDNPTILYCEGADTAPHRYERNVACTAEPRAGFLVMDPVGKLADRNSYSPEVQLIDARLFPTADGIWVQTDGSGICPLCLVARPDLYRIATEYDVVKLMDR